MFLALKTSHVCIQIDWYFKKSITSDVSCRVRYPNFSRVSGLVRVSGFQPIIKPVKRKKVGFQPVPKPGKARFSGFSGFIMGWKPETLTKPETREKFG